jgi:hypothetical protein
VDARGQADVRTTFAPRVDRSGNDVGGSTLTMAPDGVGRTRFSDAGPKVRRSAASAIVRPGWCLDRRPAKGGRRRSEGMGDARRRTLQQQDSRVAARGSNWSWSMAARLRRPISSTRSSTSTSYSTASSGTTFHRHPVKELRAYDAAGAVMEPAGPQILARRTAFHPPHCSKCVPRPTSRGALMDASGDGPALDRRPEGIHDEDLVDAGAEQHARELSRCRALRPWRGLGRPVTKPAS